MRVLLVGINPGVLSAQTGHHFAGPTNRFWGLLYEAGIVPEPITHEDDVRLPEWGLGMTNLVARPSPGIDDLSLTLSPNPAVWGRLWLTLVHAGIGDCRVGLYDVSGRCIRTFPVGEHVRGSVTLPSDGRDDVGRPVPAGLYIVRAQAQTGTAAKKLVVLR